MENEIKIIHTDGACKFNNEKDISKRKMYWAFVDSSRKDIPNDPFMRNFSMGTAINAQRKHSVASNNIAELLAVLEALKYCANPVRKYDNILIKTDSKVIYAWIKSGTVNKKINAPEFTQMVLDEVRQRIAKFSTINFEVVPREDNLAGHILEEFT